MPLILAATAANAQIQVQQVHVTFANDIPGVLEAPIYGLELEDPVHQLGDIMNAKSGNTATGIPAGTQS